MSGASEDVELRSLPTLLRLLGRAGLDLRMELADQDRHDEILAEWERSRSPGEPAIGRQPRRRSRDCSAST
ncbi:MAG: hypothetical protein LH616_18505, partial [Ilumatobacteraceae bacterium]|nr:hypothetical protein [Ilumatobacteraceae bacterium]